MLCCVGLIGGLAVGQSLGGPWTYIAPAAGFGIGLLADMKFMHKMHGKPAQPTSENAEKPIAVSASTANVVGESAQPRMPQVSNS